jgi:hypothetical protein
MHLTPDSGGVSLLKMLTYDTCAALLRLSRHSSFIRATAERLTLVELNDFIKIDVKSRC